MEIFLNFSDNNNNKLRSGTHLSRPIVHTTLYGKESIINFGAKIWELVPQNIKEANSLRNGLTNGYHQIARVIFVSHTEPKLDLSNFFAKSCNAWLIE